MRYVVWDMPCGPAEMKARMEAALELSELAVEMYEMTVRRAHPELSDAEVARRVCQWRQARPGAEAGDAEGRSVPWPRRRS
jgi:hypothetical protein